MIRFYLAGVLVGLLLSAVLLSCAANAADYSFERGDVVSIYDGDTFYLRLPSCTSQIPSLCARAGVRLRGIDAPEMRATCPLEAQKGRAARERLRELLDYGHRMQLRNVGREKYGRLLADLEIDGRDVGERLIAEGLARPYHGGTRQSWCR